MKNKGLICQLLFSVKNKKTKVESIRNIYNQRAIDAMEINIEYLKDVLSPEIDIPDGMYIAEVGLDIGFPMWAEYT